jgi:polysaccharide deacetylase 2 family uncharacterized protein YibQ
LARALHVALPAGTRLATVLAIGILIGLGLAYPMLPKDVHSQVTLRPEPQPVPRQPTAPPRLSAEPLPLPSPLPEPPAFEGRTVFGQPPSGEPAAAQPLPAPNAGPAPVTATVKANASAEPPVVTGLPPSVRGTPVPDTAALAPPAKTVASPEPAWQRNAIPVVMPEGRPLIAILIDDVGIHRRNSARVVELKAPLTLAYMTYADDLERQSAAARALGHELMLHVPMEPIDGGVDAGPNALIETLAPEEIRRRLTWDLDRFEGYVGINNHMGSRFTASEPGMAIVMEELKRRGLLFVDSRTIGTSVAGRMAERYAVPHADRDVFLDNEQDGAAVHERLAELEAVARRRGMAIGIGHPHDGTIAALAEWLPTLEAKGFTLVPVSAVVERRMRAEPRSAAVTAPPPG